MERIEKLKKRLEKIESHTPELAVFVDVSPPEDVIEIVGIFNDLNEAKEVAKAVSKKRNMHDLSWLIDLDDEPKPPFVVFISKSKLEMKVVDC